MKFLVVILFSITVIVITLVLQVRADFAGVRQEYLTKLVEFNQAQSDYLVAKSSYLSSHTLSAQTQAIEKAKDALKKRDELLVKHFELILNHPNVAQSKIIQEESNFYANHLIEVSAIASVEDVTRVAKKAEDRIKFSNLTSKQSVGQILIAKVENLRLKYEDLLNLIEEEVAKLTNSTDKPGLPAVAASDAAKAGGLSLLKTWINQVKSKDELAKNKIADVKKRLSNLKIQSYNLEKDFNEIRVDIVQANLLLKEGTNYMKEIVEEMKFE